jgi:sugar lactone lactonase YvrE
LVLSAAASWWTPAAAASSLTGPVPGTVLIADTDNNRVVAVAPDGTQSTILGTGLNQPLGVATDAAGDVLIADSGNNRVIGVAPNGTQMTVGTGLGSPFGLGVDAAGDVYIADEDNNRVVKVAPDGTQSTVDTDLSAPTGVAVDAAGDVYIADLSNSRVVKIAPDGTRSTVGTDLNDPYGVTVDPAGDVYIADTGNRRVLKVAPDGSQSTFGTGLSTATDVAVDQAGDIYIADYGANQVVKVAPDGTQSTVGTGLNHPAGVAVVPGKPQTITYASTPPTHPRIGGNYPVSATGGDSGNPVTFTVNASSAANCKVTNHGDNTGIVAFTDHGTCAVFAHQAGNDTYADAYPVRQRMHVYKAVQTVDFTSTPPSRPRVGGSYDVSATGGDSGNPVTFTANPSSAANCTVTNHGDNTGTVTFTDHGRCAVFAHQAGDGTYEPAAGARQRMHVYPAG